MHTMTDYISIHRSHPGYPEWKTDLHWMSDAYLKALEEEILTNPARSFRRIDPSKKYQVIELFEGLLLQTDQSCLQIACFKDKRIGYFLGMIKNCIAEIPPRIGYVNGLYIEPQYRNQGIGQKLLDQGKSWFQEKKLPLAELYLSAGNGPGERFWLRNGYQKTESVLLCPLPPPTS